MRFFGPERPVSLEESARVETPVGAQCAGGCGMLIGEGDQGWAIPHLGGPRPSLSHYHHRCLLNAIMGDASA